MLSTPFFCSPSECTVQHFLHTSVYTSSHPKKQGLRLNFHTDVFASVQKQVSKQVSFPPQPSTLMSTPILHTGFSLLPQRVVEWVCGLVGSVCIQFGSKSDNEESTWCIEGRHHIAREQSPGDHQYDCIPTLHGVKAHATAFNIAVLVIIAHVTDASRSDFLFFMSFCCEYVALIPGWLSLTENRWAQCFVVSTTPSRCQPHTLSQAGTCFQSES